jgi:predicted phage terminase large subunit-like protein
MRIPQLPSRTRAITLARSSFAAYASLQYRPFQLGYPQKIIVAALERVERGEIKRLIIAMPPRHGKSLLCSELFPAWFLGKHPDSSIIATSYGLTLAQDFGRKVRNHVASSLHRTVFPSCVLADDSSAINRFNLLAGGGYIAAGSGGPITGRGAEGVFLIDDPIKSSEDARSDLFRANLHEWFQSTAYTRLGPDAAIILIATRWHADDLSGWLLREHPEENWVAINLPAIAERDEPEGRKEGAALWPKRYPLATLERIKEAVGGSTWASLYQQRPAAAEGALFKRDWWKKYSSLPERFEQIVLSLDTAFKTGTSNDYSVGVVLGVAQSAYYILDVWRGKWEFPELQRKIEVLSERYKPNCLLVEDAASGQSLIQTLKSSTRLPVKAIRPDSDKFTRASAIAPLVEAGKVCLPQGAEWVADFIDELATFPNAAHDDQVDALVQALRYVAQVNQSGHIGLMRLEMGAARVQRGEPIATVAKSVGLSEGQVQAWVDKSATPTAAMRITPANSDAFEYARKKIEAGDSVDAAIAETLRVHRIQIDRNSLIAFHARSNTPTGPSRPRNSPPGAKNLNEIIGLT